MATAYKCDRCGKYFSLSKENNQVFTIETAKHRNSSIIHCGPINEKHYDICKECENRFYEWINKYNSLFLGEETVYEKSETVDQNT